MPMLGIQGSNVVLARNLVPADVGSHPYTVTAMQNGVTIQGSFTINIIATPVPSSISVTPDPASLQDNAAQGSQVSAVAVEMSDGSQFAGTLSVTGPA